MALKDSYIQKRLRIYIGNQLFVDKFFKKLLKNQALVIINVQKLRFFLS